LLTLIAGSILRRGLLASTIIRGIGLWLRLLLLLSPGLIPFDKLPQPLHDVTIMLLLSLRILLGVTPRITHLIQFRIRLLRGVLIFATIRLITLIICIVLISII
jgi:hypothetical protein